MAQLCREFGVSRKTGYKIFSRYRRCGLEGLADRSRRPYRQANRLAFQIENLILRYKQEHPSWGGPKIREKLRPWILASACPPLAPCSATAGDSELYARAAMIDAKDLRTQVIAGLVLMALAAVNFRGARPFALAPRARLRHTKRVCRPELLSIRRRTYARCCFSAAVTRGTLAAS